MKKNDKKWNKIFDKVKEKKKNLNLKEEINSKRSLIN